MKNDLGPNGEPKISWHCGQNTLQKMADFVTFCTQIERNTSKQEYIKPVAFGYHFPLIIR